MSDENYTEEQAFEEHQEEVQQETAEALADGAAQEIVDEVAEEVAEKETESDDEAPASSEEEAIAKLRRKLYMSPGDWYVIHTYSGHERKVKANLEQRITTQNMEDYIFAVEVPDEYVMEYRGNAKKRVRHVRIPGYAIVCMDFNEASYRVVKETPAVTMFNGKTGMASAVQDALNQTARGVLFASVKDVVTGTLAPEEAIETALATPLADS